MDLLSYKRTKVPLLLIFFMQTCFSLLQLLLASHTSLNILSNNLMVVVIHTF